MPKRTPIAVLSANLGEHPAVKAWSTLAASHVQPESVHVYRQRHWSAVYRLVHAGPDGTHVMVKRCRQPAAWIERTVYEHIIPYLRVSAPRYYGGVPDGDGWWLFLEDVGNERYVEDDPGHRALAGRWLATMHLSARGVAAAARLPDGGPRRYLGYLQSTRQAIIRNLSNRLLTGDDVEVLEAIVSECDAVEARWSEIEAVCQGVPSTLVHSDFRARNAYVRVHPEGARLFPLDWETAGWGVPVADLTRIDLDAYSLLVRQAWPSFTPNVVRDLAQVGRIFQWLAAINWEGPTLDSDQPAYVRYAMDQLRVYCAEPPAALQLVSG